MVIRAYVLALCLGLVVGQCGPDGSVPYPPGETECPGGPGGGGGGGTDSPATGCSVSEGNCAKDGSSNFCERALTYDTSTGLFTGTIKTNLCSNHEYGQTSKGMLSGGQHTADCIEQTFPHTDTTSGPVAAPLRGRAGMSISGGINIYNPLEAGFTTGQACDNGLGDCAAGVDVPTCESELEQECGEEHVSYGMLLDTCAGHAMPYHYHKDLACDYDAFVSGPHSPLIGLALDGRGIYGVWEGEGASPNDLDACNGHFGPVPETTVDGDTYPAATNVYHYHTTHSPPYTVGCYGPVADIEECKSLYPSCNGPTLDLCTSKGAIEYDDDCPCFHQSNVDATTYNQEFTFTEACGVVPASTTGASGAGATSSTTSSTASSATATASTTSSSGTSSTGSTATTSSSSTATASGSTSTTAASTTGSGSAIGPASVFILAVCVLVLKL